MIAAGAVFASAMGAPCSVDRPDYAAEPLRSTRSTLTLPLMVRFGRLRTSAVRYVMAVLCRTSFTTLIGPPAPSWSPPLKSLFCL